ncbi:MAG: permease-like cell division protein FtsX [Clostridia bacterium]|nr:permease-like cell division protein FtsX [Clostridia bacterium]
MKLTSVKYLVSNGFKNIWLNKLMSIASIGVLVACMSVIGLAVALSINVDHALSQLEKENVVMVFFDDRNSALYAESNLNSETGTYNEITEKDYTVHNFEEAIKLCAEIEKLDNIATVEYFTGEDSLNDQMATMGDQAKFFESFLFSDDYGNPMPSGARVSFVNLEKFDQTLDNLEAMKGVDSTSSTRDLAEKITLIKHAISIVGFWIVAILLLISLMIVSNTIRVTMYSRKLEISIMKAVGATDSFVRLPFMIEGVTIGLLSAVITVVILYFVYKAVAGTILNVMTIATLIPFGDFFWIIFGIFAGIGVFAGLFSSAFMINKYLRKEGSEFRAL